MELIVNLDDDDVSKLKEKYGDVPIASIVAMIVKMDIEIGHHISELSDQLKSTTSLSEQISNELMKLKRVHEDAVTEVIIKGKSLVVPQQEQPEKKKDTSLLKKAKDAITKLEEQLGSEE